MLVTNQTNYDYWFGPLHLPAGVGQELTVDDTSETSLYLTDDAVADALNALYLSGAITVGTPAQPFPRPTGVPALVHGDGSPEGVVYSAQGSIYMRRDNSGPSNSLYVKSTGVAESTGWGAVSVLSNTVMVPIVNFSPTPISQTDVTSLAAFAYSAPVIVPAGAAKLQLQAITYMSNDNAGDAAHLQLGYVEAATGDNPDPSYPTWVSDTDVTAPASPTNNPAVYLGPVAAEFAVSPGDALIITAGGYREGGGADKTVDYYAASAILTFF